MVSGRGLGDVAGWEEQHLSSVFSSPLSYEKYQEDTTEALLPPPLPALLLLLCSSSRLSGNAVYLCALPALVYDLSLWNICWSHKGRCNPQQKEGKMREFGEADISAHVLARTINSKKYVASFKKTKIPLVICRNKLKKISEKEGEKKKSHASFPWCLQSFFLTSASCCCPVV